MSSDQLYCKFQQVTINLNLHNQNYNSEVLAINNLSLHNFRNYPNYNVNFTPKPVIITGDNGIGKTNLLEAISLLSPGRGLRNAKILEMGNKGDHDFSSWQITALVNSVFGNVEIVTSYQNANDKTNKRTIKINDQISKSQAELAKIFSVIWLTPQMDPIFLGPSAARRKFFDRLVFNFDAEHANRVSSYENLMSQRLKLLKSNNIDNLWLNVLEQQMAEVAIAIAAARMQTLEYLQAVIEQTSKEFPKAILKIEGELEQQINNMPSLQLEEQFKKKLFASRQIDSYSGRTNAGIHRSDLLVYHSEKRIEADKCSTGEQKALLISIILAEAKARIKWRCSVPVILLDEVVAHLDESRRIALFDELIATNAQFWITGTDAGIFSTLKTMPNFLNYNEHL